MQGIFNISIQIREKQLYLYKSYTENFIKTNSKSYSAFSSFAKEISTSLQKYIQQPFQVFC